MRSKRILIILALITLIIATILISLRAYYVLVAVIAGGLLLYHRELWSLLRGKMVPPVDERVKANIDKAIRNSFAFFILATILLMLIFSIGVGWHPELLHILGGLFVAIGITYLLSYFFYDRVEPNLSIRKLWIFRTFLLVAGTSIVVFLLGVFLHNLISGLVGVEEPVFFIIAVFVSPIGLATGLMGSLVLYIIGLVGRREPGESFG